MAPLFKGEKLMSRKEDTLWSTDVFSTWPYEGPAAAGTVTFEAKLIYFLAL